MPAGKRARPEGTNCPSGAFLPEAVLNYVLTVEEYVFALPEGKMKENCEGAGKVRETRQMISFSFMRSDKFFIHAMS